MIFESCNDCTLNCCQVGPGPYKKVRRGKFTSNYLWTGSYNTICEGLTDDRKCKYWGTDKIPSDCRTSVCPHRSYTKKELKELKRLTREFM